MQPTLEYYKFLLKSLNLLKEMVEAENVPAVFTPKSQEITKELLSAIVDYMSIIQKEIYKLQFWDWVMSTDWARKLYFSMPDEEEEDGF